MVRTGRRVPSRAPGLPLPDVVPQRQSTACATALGSCQGTTIPLS